jgi:hypothetical protein
LLLVLVARSLFILFDALFSTATDSKDEGAVYARTAHEDSVEATQPPPWRHLQQVALQLAAQLFEALQAAINRPVSQQQQQQQQQQQPAVVWLHMLQLHTKADLVGAVGKMEQERTASYLQIMQVHSSSSSSGGGGGHADTSASSDGSSSSSSSEPASGASGGALLSCHLTAQSQLQRHACSDRFGGLTSLLVGFCCDVAYAVPLPEVCNIPYCKCLGRLSEAGAAVKACAGCGVRYCSLGCQTSPWPFDRKARRWLRSSAGGCR